MSRFQKGLMGIVFPVAMILQGCSMSGAIRNAVISKEKCVDMRKSRYAPDIKEAADKKAKSNKFNDLRDAMKGYGSLCELDNMDEAVRGMIGQDIEVGMEYGCLGDRYYKMCGKSKMCGKK